MALCDHESATSSVLSCVLRHGSILMMNMAEVRWLSCTWLLLTDCKLSLVVTGNIQPLLKVHSRCSVDKLCPSKQFS